MFYYTIQRLQNASGVDYIDISTYSSNDITAQRVDWETYQAAGSDNTSDVQSNIFILSVPSAEIKKILSPEAVLDPASADPTNADTLVTITGDPVVDSGALAQALNEILPTCCT